MGRSIYEVKCQKELEAQGYQVEWKMRRSWMMRRGVYNQDFFNLFDLLAYKKGEPFRWISCKGKAGIPGAHRKEVEEFWMPPYNIKEIWARSMSRKKGNYWYKIVI